MLKHPFNDERCINRLLSEYHTHNSLLIAVDFDNTIYDYHNLGDDYQGILDLLRKCKSLGMIIILFTVETNESAILTKLEYLTKNGIEVDYVNESPIYPGSKKPYYNILLDDRAGISSSVNQLNKVVEIIEDEKFSIYS